MTTTVGSTRPSNLESDAPQAAFWPRLNAPRSRACASRSVDERPLRIPPRSGARQLRELVDGQLRGDRGLERHDHWVQIVEQLVEVRRNRRRPPPRRDRPFCSARPRQGSARPRGAHRSYGVKGRAAPWSSSIFSASPSAAPKAASNVLLGSSPRSCNAASCTTIGMRGRMVHSQLAPSSRAAPRRRFPGEERRGCVRWRAARLVCLADSALSNRRSCSVERTKSPRTTRAIRVRRARPASSSPARRQSPQRRTASMGGPNKPGRDVLRR